jgi:hypothetical protein
MTTTKSDMRFTFNTGRLYTKEGQIIHVEIADGRVWFNDESRGIPGSFELCNTWDEYAVRELVMANYDHGNYRGESSPCPGDARYTDERFDAWTRAKYPEQYKEI